MDDTLARICRDKRADLQNRQAGRPLSQVEADAANAPPVRGFGAALRRDAAEHGFGLIAEIKRASPSKGLIRKDFDPESLAGAYDRGGATCLSVLTDTPYFQGRDADLVAARSAVPLPVLRKDFMLDPYQIAEARALGADCILLILAALSDAQAGELAAAATSWNLDILAEVHDRTELERALALPTGLIGVNNRNLKTLQVDLATSVDLLPDIPDDRLAVSESGLHSPADLRRMHRSGAAAFLIGESLMRQDDVAHATASLLSAARQGLPDADATAA